MSLLIDALWMSLMSLAMAFTILILIMLAIKLSASIFGRMDQPVPEAASARPESQVRRAPVVEAGDGIDGEQISVVLAALQAAEEDLPSGGRVYIEKVSRRSE